MQGRLPCVLARTFYILKFVEVVEAHRLQLLARGAYVGGRVEVRDKGQAKGYFRLRLDTGEHFQIIEDGPLALCGVALVNVGVHVLDVHYEMVDEGQDGFHVLLRHVQARFQRDAPRGVDALIGFGQMAEGSDEVGAQQRLSTAESDAAARGLEIEVVCHHHLQEFVGSDGFPDAISFQALWVQAIAAVQRASVEGHERRDPLTVDRQAVAGNGNKGRSGVS